jgi:hypothetical protein
MDVLSDSVFKKMFCVDRPTFSELLDLISPVMIERDVQKARNSSGTPIQPKECLAVTLRWLAGGLHMDLCFAWGIGYSTFYSDRGVLWPTIEAIDAVFHIGFPINDTESWNNCPLDFMSNQMVCLMVLSWYLMVLLFRIMHLLYMKSQKGKITGSKKVDLPSLLWLDAMLMLGSFQQLQATVAVPMTLWHGTIANYAKQLSMISVYPQSIFSLVMRHLQIIISSSFHGVVEGLTNTRIHLIIGFRTLAK